MMQTILNPVRMRIVQQLLLHETATAAELSQALPDVPKASLYRHIKKLTDCGVLEVFSTQRVRGTLQRTYRMTRQIAGMANGREITDTIYSFLIMLAGDFERYHQKHADPDDYARDMLFASQATLMMSDQEFEGLMEKIGALINQALTNEYREDRKPRRLSMICSPYFADHDDSDVSPP